jgi:hypothetical protein
MDHITKMRLEITGTVKADFAAYRYTEEYIS